MQLIRDNAMICRADFKRKNVNFDYLARRIEHTLSVLVCYPCVFLMKNVRYILLFLLILATSGVWAQSIYTEFGKNRIQYHDDFDDWWMYESENFVTYWYGKGRNVAQSVIQLAELDYQAIQSVLEHRFNEKVQIIVYLDVSDMKQSNIGLEDIFGSRNGRTRVMENKMFVYFNGDHQDLRDRIRQGIAEIYLESMLYGSNLQEVVQNAVLLHLPDWFKDGLIAYMGTEWNSDVDNELRDLFMLPKEKYYDYDKLARDHPAIAGHSMWYYIGETYGKSTISNILYLTRINRNLESAFVYVIGYELKQIKAEWSEYFQERFEAQADAFARHDNDLLIEIKNKRNIPYTSLNLSPDKKYLAYARNEVGKVKIYIRNVQTGETFRIYKFGIRNIIQETDYNYPVIAWHPNSRVISIIHERRDVIKLVQIDLDEGTMVTQPIDPQFDRIYSADYWTPDTLMFAASTDGYSDIYKYIPKTRQTIQVTEDFYDDLDITVATLADVKGILWRSNRTNLELRKRELDTIMPIENFDVYFMFPDSSGWRLLNLTQTPFDNEKLPVAIGDRSVAYLTNESGVWNRKVVNGPLSDKKDFDYHTNYDRSVLGHTSRPDADVIYEHILINGKHVLLESRPEILDSMDIGRTGVEKNLIIVDDPEDENMDQLDVVDERYLFQSQFKPPPPKASDKPSVDTVENEPVSDQPGIPIDFLRTPSTDRDPVTYDQSKVIEYIPSRAIAHRLRFRLDEMNVTLDNSLLFTNLNTFSGVRQELQNPPLGILLRARVKDLFEDYVIEGGMRFPTSFNGSEYYLFFDNRKRRIDWRYAIYRKSVTNSVEGGTYSTRKDQTITAIGLVTARYPLDIYRSVSVTGTVRNDRIINLSTDLPTLEAEPDDQQRIGLRIEYIFDNTLEYDINYRHGSRYKFFVEFVNRFDLNIFEEGQSARFSEGFMTVLGVDARHYQRLDKHSILAARFYASTSLGSERILHYLGGVENWLFSKYNDNVPIPQDRNFAYQAIAANMRGFEYNARNGSSVALINLELRVPFMRYLSRKKLRSSFLRNLQVVGFVDVGTAWHGTDPFSNDNPLNTIQLTNPPTVKVDVTYYRNPVVVGYGVGARTMILGYFLKLDYGWGWETNRVNRPILHFSLGTDF